MLLCSSPHPATASKMAPKQTARKASNYHRLPLTHRPTRSERPEPTCGCGITDKTLHEGVTCEVLKRRMAGKAPKNPKKKCVKAPPPHRARYVFWVTLFLTMRSKQGIRRRPSESGRPGPGLKFWSGPNLWVRLGPGLSSSPTWCGPSLI